MCMKSTLHLNQPYIEFQLLFKAEVIDSYVITQHWYQSLQQLMLVCLGKGACVNSS